MLNINARLLLLNVLFLAACSKKDPEPDNTSLLTGRAWRIDSMTMPLPIATGFTSMVVAYNDLPACRTDNTYRFEPNGSYAFEDGIVFCALSSQTGTGNWRWLNNETQVEVSMPGFATTVYNVAELSRNRLKLVEALPYGGGTDHMWRVYVTR